MSNKLNPKWLEAQNALIDDFQQGRKTEYALTSNFRLAYQTIIMELVKRHVPYVVIQCGGGVVKVTTNTKTCPKCRGTGMC